MPISKMNPCKCGSTSTDIQQKGDCYYVKCLNCGKDGPFVRLPGRMSHAVEQWNKQNETSTEQKID